MHQDQDGAFLLDLLITVLVCGAAGNWIAWRFRLAVRHLMAANPPPSSGLGPLPAITPSMPVNRQCSATLGDNRSAQRRLLLCLVALCLFMGLLQAWWTLHILDTSVEGTSTLKTLRLATLFAWLMVPIAGLMYRWSTTRVMLLTIAYFLLTVAFTGWGQSISELVSLSSLPLVTAGPVLFVLWLIANDRLRAIGPLLFPCVLMLVSASLFGLNLLRDLVEHPDWASTLKDWSRTLGAHGLMALAAFMPWLLAWPLLRRLIRSLVSQFEAGRFSDLMYLAGGYWLIQLSMQALWASHSHLGARSAQLLLLWLAWPIGWRLIKPLLKPAMPPSNLLLLRVFESERDVRALYHRVVDRWRFIGTVSLIAGTDLALDTLEPGELFDFLGGSLPRRYIGNTRELHRRLRDVDRGADPDGRYRVTDFYCYDSTWRSALTVLVRKADAVLMDLRRMRSTNQGCLYELSVLRQATHLNTIVLLTDARTDWQAVEAVLGPTDTRFHRLDVVRLDAATAEQVVGSLFLSLNR